MPRLPRLGRALLAVLLLLAPGCTRPAGADDLGGPRLRILLTNDDGFGAPGLVLLRQMLMGAGHHVTVVAPSSDRSGSSVSITTRGDLASREVEPGVHAVDGTPADCVRLALSSLLDEPVDLVVSGVNFGQNVGGPTVSSGTVGAAITAVIMGVPAVAVSQAVDPQHVPDTVRFFPDAARFATRLVSTLARSGRTPVLPEGLMLNVNYPSRHEPDLAGVRLTRQGRSSLYVLVYQPGPDGRIGMAFAPNPNPETVENADTTALAEGYVAITPLDPSWSAPDAVRESLRPLADALDAHHRKPAPTPAP